MQEVTTRVKATSGGSGHQEQQCHGLASKAKSLFHHAKHSDIPLDVRCILPTHLRFGQAVELTIQPRIDTLIYGNKAWEERMRSPVPVDYHGEQDRYIDIPEVNLADNVQLTLLEVIDAPAALRAGQCNPGKYESLREVASLGSLKAPPGPFQEEQQFIKTLSSKPVQVRVQVSPTRKVRRSYRVRVDFHLVLNGRSVVEVSEQVPVEIASDMVQESDPEAGLPDAPPAYPG